MTATAIPQSDPALLEAQAKAGQAGVAAYEAAKAEMARTRQSETDSAMTAAAGRGAPAGAMEAALGQTNQMYDRRNAALTTAQAAYEDALASRRGRMADYSSGVNEARSLIGEQAAQAVAPIDAQTRYAVAGIESRGRMSVDQLNAAMRSTLAEIEAKSRANVDSIEAQMRLKQLEMEAAAAAAAARGGGGRGGGGGGGGGGGSTKKPSLSQSELAAGVTARGTGNLQRARATAEGAMRQTAEQSRQAASYTGNSMNNSLREALARAGEFDRVADGRAEMARQAASYTGRAAQEWQAKQNPSNTRIGLPEFTNSSMPFPVVGGTGGGTPTAGAPFSVRDNPQVAAARAAFEAAARAPERNRVAPSLQPTTMPTPAHRAALQMSPLYGEGQSFFTPQQFDAMAQSPDASVYDAMMSAGGLQRIGGIGERLGFDQIDPSSLAPGTINPMTGEQYRRGDMTALDPVGPEALRRAMWQAGVDMEAEGYKIDANELQNVLDSGNDVYEPGDSVYDVESRRMGGPSYNEQRTNMEAEVASRGKQAQEDANQEWTDYQRGKTMSADEQAAIDESAKDAMVQQFGIAPTVPGLNSTQVYDLLFDEDNYSAFTAAMAKLEEARADDLPWSEVYQGLVAEGLDPSVTPANRAMLAILEQFY